MGVIARRRGSYQTIIESSSTEAAPQHANVAWLRYVLVIVASIFRTQNLRFASQPIDAKVTCLEYTVTKHLIFCFPILFFRSPLADNTSFDNLMRCCPLTVGPTTGWILPSLSLKTLPHRALPAFSRPCELTFRPNRLTVRIFKRTRQNAVMEQNSNTRRGAPLPPLR